MASGINIRNTLGPGIAAMAVSFPHELEENVLNTAIKALDYARANAPWSDRTGDARRGLDVDVRQEAREIVWEMYHSVDYGIWLETKNSGELAIIMPTLEMFASQVGRGLSEKGGL